MNKEKENIKTKTLVKEFKENRNEELFKQIIEQFRFMIEAFKKKYFCFGKDEDDIEQEIIIKIYEAIELFEEEKNRRFIPFARLIVERHLITEFRKTQQQRRIPQNNFFSLDEHISNETEGTIERIETISDEKQDLYKTLKNNERKENVKIILEYLAEHLTDLELNTFLLRMNDFNYSEIADKLNTNKKAVDNALQRSYNKIKKEINNL